MKPLVAATLLFLLIALPCLAEEDADTVRAKAAIQVFRKHFTSQKMSTRMQALWDLAHVEHELAIKEIGESVLTDGDPEIRAAGAQILGKVKADPEIAGPYLRRYLPKNDDYPEVQLAFVRAIGDIGYTDGRAELIDACMRFLEEDYQHVTAAVLRSLARLEDKKALPFLLKLAEYGPEGKTWKCLTGQWGRKKVKLHSSDPLGLKNEKFRKELRKSIPEDMDPEELYRLYGQPLEEAVQALTGVEFEDAGAFRKWMEEHAKELGFKRSELDSKKKLKPKSPKNSANEKDKKKRR